MLRTSIHDAYVARAPEFARPILTKLLSAVRKGCPGALEVVRWSQPSFDHHGILAGLSAHKAHVNLTFWHGQELEDPEGLLIPVGSKTDMALMRFEAPADLPTQKVLVQYVRAAARWNEAQAAAPAKRAKKAMRVAKAPVTPPDLAAALKRNKRAAAAFAAFSNTNQKDYVEWLTEAKREETRARRLAQALEWMAEGKPRSWKYMPEWK